MNSELSDVKLGVPQGSRLSPELFNVFVQTLPNVILNSRLFQFADDSAMVKIVKEISDCRSLQRDLGAVEVWSLDRGLYLNGDKSVHLRVKLKKSELQTFNYIINGKSLVPGFQHSHLEVILDNRFLFHANCDMIVNKSLRTWALIKNVSIVLGPNILLKLYLTYILPIIEYSNVVWVPKISQSI